MDLKSIKLEYIHNELNIKDLSADPMQQFELWMAQVLEAEVTYPNAAHLSTIGEDGYPSSRVILIKDVKKDGFVFFTNYESNKGREIKKCPKACIAFFWKEFDRQIRIIGELEKVDRLDSEKYFFSRPIESQISAISSPQSAVISKEELLDQVEKTKSQKIKIPDFWGGYILKPKQYEFWQGRPNRLHDRFRYRNANGNWMIERLAP